MKERARRFSQLFYPSDNIQCRLEIFMGAQAPMAPMLPTPLSKIGITIASCQKQTHMEIQQLTHRYTANNEDSCSVLAATLHGAWQ